MFIFLYLCIRFVLADPVVVRTIVEIPDEDGREWTRIAHQSLDALSVYQTDWWDTLPIMRWSDFPPLSEEQVSKEAEALLNWYIDYGWRDAIIEYSWKPFDERLLFGVPREDPYTVRFKVYTGQAWSLERIVLEGIEHDGKRLRLPNEMNKTQSWNRQVQMSVEEDVIRQIKRLGYANPKVYWQSKILSPHLIELQGNVEWGPKYQFGKVELQSETVKPLNLKQEKWTGEMYSPKRIEILVHRLEMNPAVSTVRVEEQIDPKNNLVNIIFHISPNAESEIRPVGGLTTEATIWAVDGGLTWQWIHHRSPLLQVSGTHTLGYRTFPQWFDISQQGWAANNTLETTFGLATRSGFQGLLEGQALSDMQFGFKERVLGVEAGVRWIPNSLWTLDTTVGRSQHQFDTGKGQEELFDDWFIQESLLQEVYTDQVQFQLSRLQVGKSYFTVQAIPFGLMNQHRFLRVWSTAEQRIKFGNVTVRNRGEYGVLYWPEEPLKSLHNRFFLGGGHSLRGFAFNKVHADGYKGQRFDTNVGGDKSLFVSTEFQYSIFPGYRLLTFLDAGKVYTSWDNPIELNNLYSSTGFGVIIPTMLGDVALTEAVRLTKAVDFPNQPPRFMFHCILVRDLGE